MRNVFEGSFTKEVNREGKDIVEGRLNYSNSEAKNVRQHSFSRPGIYGGEIKERSGSDQGTTNPEISVDLGEIRITVINE